MKTGMEDLSLRQRALKLGCPPKYAGEIAELVEAWFYYNSDARDAGYSTVSAADLPALVNRIARWAEKR
jgi:hypothetical protein